jgi:putative hemolysin
MPIAVEIVIIAALILFNAFFALAELAVVSSRKGRLQVMIDEGNRRARVALELAEEPSLLLSTVQVGLTLVSIIVGVFGSETFARPLSDYLVRATRLSRGVALPISFVVVVALITYVTVIVGELVPKRIALSNPERWAVRVAPTMRVVSRMAAPLVAFLTWSSGLFVRLLRLPLTAPPVSDAEISMLFEEGISAGVFEPAEKEIVDRLLRLSDRRLNSVMTPGVDVAWLDVDAPPEEIIEFIAENPYTAFPVCQDDLDHVLGIVFAADLIPRLLRDEPADLRALMRPPLVLYEGFNALQAIDRLRQSNTHLAIVINEYGGTEGIVTLSDIFESLVGELPSFETPEVVRRPDGSLLVSGLFGIDDLKELLQVDEFPEEEAGYQTLAGLLITNLDRIPRTGDIFEWDSYRFEVVDMDGARVDQVLISHLHPPI